MWYWSTDGIRGATGYATSLGGVKWTKYQSGPVLDVGPQGSWDEAAAAASSVIFDGTTYHMWYYGHSGDPFTTARIGYATSPDGISWTKHPSNPVFKNGSGWESNLVWSPTVIFDGTQFHMWYSGYGADPIGDRPFIGYATSTDGVNWQRHASNPVLGGGPAGSWDAGGVFSCFVFIDNANKYHMWYSGQRRGIKQIGYAYSDDGITWHKDEKNPVLKVGTAWDGRFVEIPRVIFDGSQYHMWYASKADRVDETRRVGYAFSK